MMDLLSNPIFQGVISGIMATGITDYVNNVNSSSVENDFCELIQSVCDELSEIYPVQIYRDDGFTFWDNIAKEIQEGLVYKLGSLSDINTIIKSSLEVSNANYNIVEISKTFRHIFLKRITEYDFLYEYTNMLYLDSIFNTISNQVNSIEKILKYDLMSGLEVTAIEKDIKKYVINDSFNLAINLLEKQNYMLICGNPGTGKTTLARMLIYYYLTQGYELVAISKDIEKAFSLYDDKKKQIFYYNDFLGSNLLEVRLIKNEEKRLENFIKMIYKSKNKKIILTSRIYLVNQAKNIYDNFLGTKFTEEKFVVRVGDYTKEIRAKILYNHLRTSDISKQYIDVLLNDRNIINIINHPNYTPRIVEWMTDFDKLCDIDEKDFYTNFMENLNNPMRLWEHAFEKHITEFSRYYLYILYTFNRSVNLSTLNDAFYGFIKILYPGINDLILEEKISNSIKELENSFITIFNGSNNDLFIDFQNPSIKDYIYYRLKHNMTLIRYIVTCSVRFCQISMFFEGKDSENRWGILVDSVTMDKIQHVLINNSGSNGGINFNKLFFQEVHTYYRFGCNLPIDRDEDLTEQLQLNVALQIHDMFNLSTRPEIRFLLKTILEKYDISGEITEVNYYNTNVGGVVDLIKELSLYEDLDINLILNNLTKTISYPKDITEFVKIYEVYPNKFIKFCKGVSEQFLNKISDIIENDICEIEYDGSRKSSKEILEIIHNVESFFELKLEVQKERSLGALIFYSMDADSAIELGKYNDVNIGKSLSNAIELSTLWGPAGTAIKIVEKYEKEIKSVINSTTKEAENNFRNSVIENISIKFSQRSISYSEDDFNEYISLLSYLMKVLNIDFSNEKKQLEISHQRYLNEKKSSNNNESKNRNTNFNVFAIKNDISDDEVMDIFNSLKS